MRFSRNWLVYSRFNAPESWPTNTLYFPSSALVDKTSIRKGQALHKSFHVVKTTKLVEVEIIEIKILPIFYLRKE